MIADENKRNLVFFEALSMRELYDCMCNWQGNNRKRLLSVNIQQDSGKFYCIALTNPTEAVITDVSGNDTARVWEGRVGVHDSSM